MGCCFKPCYLPSYSFGYMTFICGLYMTVSHSQNRDNSSLIHGEEGEHMENGQVLVFCGILDCALHRILSIALDHTLLVTSSARLSQQHLKPSVFHLKVEFCTKKPRSFVFILLEQCLLSVKPWGRDLCENCSWPRGHWSGGRMLELMPSCYRILNHTSLQSWRCVQWLWEGWD